MIGRIEQFFLKLRRAISRSEWNVRLLKLPKAKGTEAEAGLVLIQIDGLARPQIEQALKNRHMPFLKKLIQKEDYTLHTLYSGLPSNTPAFQGELFYGVRACVPAFSYLNRRTGKIFRMYDPEVAATLQVKLSQEGEGLLQNGSAYSNIFSGGAKESIFCAATLDWRKILRGSRVFSLVIFIFSNAWSFVRVGGLLILEFVLALIDFVRGLIEGKNLWKELRFIPARVAVSILLRELVTMNAMLDTARGLPVVQLNFLGYDEQAHRRGPSSAFAHWTLKGIDDAIKRIWKSAKRSGRRDYEVWIYSDHGQETSIPYKVAHGRSIEEAVSEIFDPPHHKTEDQKGGHPHRAQWLGLPIDRWCSCESQPAKPPLPAETVVAAMGPVGHIYPGSASACEDRFAKAKMIFEKTKTPMVALTAPDGLVHMITEEGTFQLPEEAEAVLGRDHPHMKQVAQDIVNLCKHPDSGDYVLFGWSKKGVSLSFAGENGAHAGPGPAETSAFALLPATAPLRVPSQRSLRALDLREDVRQFLGRAPAAFPGRRRKQSRKQKTLRIMTYNVHSCIGMDGKLSPERIARVIAQYDPDIVALQELDVGRRRTDATDQAEAIARTLEMGFHFHPAMQLEEEKYGDAVLSHHPIRLIRSAQLPRLSGRPFLEPRGALWVGIEVEGVEYQLINTHLGLSRQERLLQCEALLGPGWLGHADCQAPIIFCGDFNAGPKSGVCKLFGTVLHDAQDVLLNHRPQSTWFGRYPINRIDHIFVDQSIAVHAVEVPRTVLTRKASDHLPLIVDVSLQ